MRTKDTSTEWKMLLTIKWRLFPQCYSSEKINIMVLVLYAKPLHTKHSNLAQRQYSVPQVRRPATLAIGRNLGQRLRKACWVSCVHNNAVTSDTAINCMVDFSAWRCKRNIFSHVLKHGMKRAVRTDGHSPPRIRLLALRTVARVIMIFSWTGDS